MDEKPDQTLDAPRPGTTRRGFLKFVVVGGGTLVVGCSVSSQETLQETPQALELPDLLDVGDVLILAEQPYANNLVLEVTADNRVRFELPRLDKGQGIMTALAMMIAEEMDADYERTDVVLSGARADRPFSLTAYSSTIRAMWRWVRPLAAEARARLVTAAGNRWGVNPGTLTTSQSRVLAPDGRMATYGELSAEAAAIRVPRVPTTPKPVSAYTLVGTPRPRKNARDIVTGRQTYTLDIDLPGAAYAVVARPPDIHGTVASWDGTAAEAMPHVIGTVEIPQTPGLRVNALEGGIAVAARTLEEAFRARDALAIQWAPGPLAGTSDADIRARLLAAALPRTSLLPGVSVLSASFDYPYMSHAPLEVQAAAAHVQGNSAEVWFAAQSPRLAAQLVADAIGIPAENVTLHVTPCGGSFGRHLFCEPAIEAAIVSQALGVPIKLMWTRKDDMRSGRFRPMSHHDLRATWSALDGTILSYEHNVSAAETDFRHGLGEAFTAAGFDLGSTAVNQLVFEASVTVPYAFLLKDQRLVETPMAVPTASWRSIYSGTVVTSNEIFIDEIARAQQPRTGRDEVAFRNRYLTSDAARACLQHVAAAGNWGGALPAGHARGVACHVEYRSAVAYLVQVDATDPRDPKLTRAWICVDVGVPINPRGIEAQLQGALMDAWSAMFRAGNHLENGAMRESSYGDFPWARMHHAPPTIEVHVMPAAPGAPTPGGCGELGYPPAAAACVNAYARATGKTYRRFPILEYV